MSQKRKLPKNENEPPFKKVKLEDLSLKQKFERDLKKKRDEYAQLIVDDVIKFFESNYQQSISKLSKKISLYFTNEDCDEDHDKAAFNDFQLRDLVKKKLESKFKDMELTWFGLSCSGAMKYEDKENMNVAIEYELFACIKN